MVLDISYLRQLGLFDPKKVARPVVVIGAGSVGSNAVHVLANMGISDITVYDDDDVEGHNIPNQLYGPSHIGMKKVLALKEAVFYLTGITITAIPERFTGDQNLEGIVLSAVDTMEARQTIWKQVKFNPSTPLFVDARMGGLFFFIHALRPYEPSRITIYEQSLHSDSEAMDIPCDQRAIGYNTVTIAGMIGGIIARFCNGDTFSSYTLFDFATQTYKRSP